MMTAVGVSNARPVDVRLIAAGPMTAQKQTAPARPESGSAKAKARGLYCRTTRANHQGRSNWVTRARARCGVGTGRAQGAQQTPLHNAGYQTHQHKRRDTRTQGLHKLTVIRIRLSPHRQAMPVKRRHDAALRNSKQNEARYASNRIPDLPVAGHCTTTCSGPRPWGQPRGAAQQPDATLYATQNSEHHTGNDRHAGR